MCTVHITILTLPWHRTLIILCLICWCPAFGTIGPTSQYKASVSVLAPLVIAIRTNIVLIVSCIASVCSAYRTRWVTITTKQTIIICFLEPCVSAVRTSKIHFVFTPFPYAAVVKLLVAPTPTVSREGVTVRVGHMLL